MELKALINNMTNDSTMFTNWMFFLGDRFGRMTIIDFDNKSMIFR